MSGAGPRRARRTRTLAVLFFLSGFPALVYQLVWQRALFRIFGVNVESVTIVVTAFMLGLGLGSLAGGLLSRSRRTPLLPLLAAIELGTAAFGLASPALFERVSAAVLGASLPVTAALSLALVLVPTLLMGATLPVLVAHLVRRSADVGGSVGLLYAVNTLGAGAACLVATVALFPFLGLRGSLHVAVAMNVAVAAGALAAWVRERRRGEPGAGALATPATGHQLVVSGAPLDVDPRRFREALLAWRIDGRPVLDPARADHREALERLTAVDLPVRPAAAGPEGSLEPCERILARTAGLEPVTDDNMGSEWRFVFGME